MLFLKKLASVVILLWTLGSVTTVFGTLSLQDVPQEILIHDQSLVPHKLVHELLGWIGNNSPYTILPQRKINIKFANQAFITAEWLRNGGDPKISAWALTTVDIHTREITIYIPMSFDISNPRHQTMFLHELVHYQQYLYYVDYNVDCSADMEWEAYALALMWFLEQNVIDEHFVEDRTAKLDSYVECS